MVFPPSTHPSSPSSLDLTNGETWKKVAFWINELLSNEKDCEIYIVGTKFDAIQGDVEQNPKRSTIESYAKSVNAKVFATSAKTGEGVNDVFQSIAEDYVRKGSSPPTVYNPMDLGLESEIRAGSGNKASSNAGLCSNC